jgi:NitT/TauT family transport system substrate-binding protein
VRSFAASTFQALLVAALALPALCGMAVAQTPVRVVLDWAWLPYQAGFVIAQDKGFYKDAGLDLTLEQGRGSATTALLVSQGNFDIGHLNVTNAAQLIGRGGPIKVVGLYQHRTAAAFIGVKGKVKLDTPQSLKGIKIGSTPGGSDGLSLRVFMRANGMKESDLNVVSLEANAKTAALFGGRIDAVSGDSPAFNAYVRATGQEPETMQLGDFGVPLLGFGFAANEGFLAKNPDAVRKFLAATKRGFSEAVRDPKAACEFMQAKVHLAGTIERCVDYFNGIVALSTPPTDPNWGRQSSEEWAKLLDTLRSVGELQSDKPQSAYFTNDFLP